MAKKEFKVKGAAVAGRRGSGNSSHHGPIGGVVIIGLPQSETIDDPELVDQIRRQATSRPVLVLTGKNSKRQIEAALDIGMVHFLRWPCQARSIMEKFADLHGVSEPSLSPEVADIDGFVASRSPAMKKIKDYLKKVALKDSNVLLTGETGTGKDVAAEFIHQNSLRKSNPLLCVNCTAFPETLLESELFGYEKGAFTNAMTARPGKFEMASGGTLFLDEIEDVVTALSNADIRSLSLDMKRHWVQHLISGAYCTENEGNQVIRIFRNSTPAQRRTLYRMIEDHSWNGDWVDGVFVTDDDMVDALSGDQLKILKDLINE